MSVDGTSRGPHGEFDWIVRDPDVDFASLFSQFDTAVMGRKTFRAILQHSRDGTLPGLEVIVFSHTLRSADYPAVSIVNDDPAERSWSLKGHSPARTFGCLVAENCFARSLRLIWSIPWNPRPSHCYSARAFQCFHRLHCARSCR